MIRDRRHGWRQTRLSEHRIYNIGSFGTGDIPSDVFHTGDGPPQLRPGERIQLARHEREVAQNGIPLSVTVDIVLWGGPELPDDFCPDIEGQRALEMHVEYKACQTEST